MLRFFETSILEGDRREGWRAVARGVECPDKIQRVARFS